MKIKSDPRHKARVEAVKRLFEKKFRPEAENKPQIVQEIIARQNEIDKLLAKNAPAWPIEQIAPVDLAVLRLAIFELLFTKKKEPYKVIIDEAVEIAKEYSGQSSAAFVNGVLGSIVKQQEDRVIKNKNI